jgi:hypothetical protein
MPRRLSAQDRRTGVVLGCVRFAWGNANLTGLMMPEHGLQVILMGEMRGVLRSGIMELAPIF